MKQKRTTTTSSSGNSFPKTQCGCQVLMSPHHARPPQTQQQWGKSVSMQDLHRDLGPSSEAWFDNLTAEHERLQRDKTPSSAQTGWSPCPAGGVVNIAASTPSHVKPSYQQESPALWQTLLPESPLMAFDATSLSGNGSSSSSSQSTERDDSTAVSFILDLHGLGVSGDEGRQQARPKHGLLALTLENSADLSWSSSMATPPKTALPPPNCVLEEEEEEEKQKGPARALFSPNTSADSELGETDPNTTIELEEASSCLFAADASHHNQPRPAHHNQSLPAHYNQSRPALRGEPQGARPCSRKRDRDDVCTRESDADNACGHYSGDNSGDACGRSKESKMGDENGRSRASQKEEACGFSRKSHQGDACACTSEISKTGLSSPGLDLCSHHPSSIPHVVEIHDIDDNDDDDQIEPEIALNINADKSLEIGFEDVDFDVELLKSPLVEENHAGSERLLRRRTSTPRYKSWSQREGQGHGGDGNAVCSTRKSSSLSSTPVRTNSGGLSPLVRRILKAEDRKSQSSNVASGFADTPDTLEHLRPSGETDRKHSRDLSPLDKQAVKETLQSLRPSLCEETSTYAADTKTAVKSQMSLSVGVVNVEDRAFPDECQGSKIVAAASRANNQQKTTHSSKALLGLDTFDSPGSPVFSQKVSGENGGLATPEAQGQLLCSDTSVSTPTSVTSASQSRPVSGDQTPVSRRLGGRMSSRRIVSKNPIDQSNRETMSPRKDDDDTLTDQTKTERMLPKRASRKSLTDLYEGVQTLSKNVTGEKQLLDQNGGETMPPKKATGKQLAGQNKSETMSPKTVTDKCVVGLNDSETMSSKTVTDKHLTGQNNSETMSPQTVADKRLTGQNNSETMSPQTVADKRLTGQNVNERTTPVDNALADFFSSPETATRQRRLAPGRVDRRRTAARSSHKFQSAEAQREGISAETNHGSGLGFESAEAQHKRISTESDHGSGHRFESAEAQCERISTETNHGSGHGFESAEAQHKRISTESNHGSGHGFESAEAQRECDSTELNRGYTTAETNLRIGPPETKHGYPSCGESASLSGKVKEKELDHHGQVNEEDGALKPSPELRTEAAAASAALRSRDDKISMLVKDKVSLVGSKNTCDIGDTNKTGDQRISMSVVKDEGSLMEEKKKCGHRDDELKPGRADRTTAQPSQPTAQPSQPTAQLSQPTAQQQTATNSCSPALRSKVTSNASDGRKAQLSRPTPQQQTVTVTNCSPISSTQVTSNASDKTQAQLSHPSSQQQQQQQTVTNTSSCSPTLRTQVTSNASDKTQAQLSRPSSQQQQQQQTVTNTSSCSPTLRTQVTSCASPRVSSALCTPLSILRSTGKKKRELSSLQPRRVHFAEDCDKKEPSKDAKAVKRLVASEACDEKHMGTEQDPVSSSSSSSVPASVAMTTAGDVTMTTPSDVAMTTPRDVAVTTPVDVAVTTPGGVATKTPSDVAVTISGDAATKTHDGVAMTRADNHASEGATRLSPRSENKAEVCVAPAKSVALPKLRLGLGKKTPRFLYPTSSQILQTCPRQVFTFPAASTAPHNKTGQEKTSHPAVEASQLTPHTFGLTVSEASNCVATTGVASLSSTDSTHTSILPVSEASNCVATTGVASLSSTDSTHTSILPVSASPNCVATTGVASLSSTDSTHTSILPVSASPNCVATTVTTSVAGPSSTESMHTSHQSVTDLSSSLSTGTSIPPSKANCFRDVLEERRSTANTLASAANSFHGVLDERRESDMNAAQGACLTHEGLGEEEQDWSDIEDLEEDSHDELLCGLSFSQELLSQSNSKVGPGPKTRMVDEALTVGEQKRMRLSQSNVDEGLQARMIAVTFNEQKTNQLHTTPTTPTTTATATEQVVSDPSITPPADDSKLENSGSQTSLSEGVERRRITLRDQERTVLNTTTTEQVVSDPSIIPPAGDSKLKNNEPQGMETRTIGLRDQERTLLHTSPTVTEQVVSNPNIVPLAGDSKLKNGATPSECFQAGTESESAHKTLTDLSWPSGGFAGFKSAAGNPVKVTDGALAIASLLFRDDDGVPCEEKVGVKSNATTSVDSVELERQPLSPSSNIATGEVNLSGSVSVNREEVGGQTNVTDSVRLDIRSLSLNSSAATSDVSPTGSISTNREEVGVNRNVTHTVSVDGVKRQCLSSSSSAGTGEGYPSRSLSFLQSTSAASLACQEGGSRTLPAAASFCGFKSASGKSVALSSKFQRKAAEMWEAVEKELREGNDVRELNDRKTVQELKAGNNVLELKDWNNVQELRDGNNFPEIGDSIAEISTDEAASDSGKHPFGGTTQTSNSPVHHSEHPACTADFALEVENDRRNCFFPNLKMEDGCVGFKTAGGRTLALSAKARQKAVGLWESVGKEFDTSISLSLQKDNAAPADNVRQTVTEISNKEGTGREKTVVKTMDTNADDTGTSGEQVAGKTVDRTDDQARTSDEKPPVSTLENPAVEKLAVSTLEKPMVEKSAISTLEKPVVSTLEKPAVEKLAVSIPEKPADKTPAVSTLKLVPPSSVPQGFRPFKAPAVLRCVTEEERHTLREPERPPPDQRNTILNHFDKPGSETLTVGKKETRGAKRKLSDDFSDDDDEGTWDVDDMERISVGDSDRVSYGEVNKSRAHSTAKQFLGEVLVKTEPYSYASDFPLQDSNMVIRSANQTSHGEILPGSAVGSFAEGQGHLRLDELDGRSVADEEMSDAVLTELSNDMYDNEATQTKSAVAETAQTSLRLSLPAFWQKGGGGGGGGSGGGTTGLPLDSEEQFLKLFPSQNSGKSGGITNVSFDSLRCDDNVSFEEREWVHSTSCKEGGKEGEEIGGGRDLAHSPNASCDKGGKKIKEREGGEKGDERQTEETKMEGRECDNKKSYKVKDFIHHGRMNVNSFRRNEEKQGRDKKEESRGGETTEESPEEEKEGRNHYVKDERKDKEKEDRQNKEEEKQDGEKKEERQKKETEKRLDEKREEREYKNEVEERYGTGNKQGAFALSCVLDIKDSDFDSSLLLPDMSEDVTFSHHQNGDQSRSRESNEMDSTSSFAEQDIREIGGLEGPAEKGDLDTHGLEKEMDSSFAEIDIGGLERSLNGINVEMSGGVVWMESQVVVPCPDGDVVSLDALTEEKSGSVLTMTVERPEGNEDVTWLESQDVRPGGVSLDALTEEKSGCMLMAVERPEPCQDDDWTESQGVGLGPNGDAASLDALTEEKGGEDLTWLESQDVRPGVGVDALTEEKTVERPELCQDDDWTESQDVRPGPNGDVASLDALTEEKGGEDLLEERSPTLGKDRHHASPDVKENVKALRGVEATVLSGMLDSSNVKYNVRTLSDVGDSSQVKYNVKTLSDAGDDSNGLPGVVASSHNLDALYPRSAIGEGKMEASSTSIRQNTSGNVERTRNEEEGAEAVFVIPEHAGNSKRDAVQEDEAEREGRSPTDSMGNFSWTDITSTFNPTQTDSFNNFSDGDELFVDPHADETEENAKESAFKEEKSVSASERGSSMAGKRVSDTDKRVPVETNSGCVEGKYVVDATERVLKTRSVHDTQHQGDAEESCLKNVPLLVPLPGSFPGFQTVNRACVSVSTQSQGKDDTSAAGTCLNNVPFPVPVPGSFPGFQTASGACVSVSTQSLGEDEISAADSCLNNVPLPVPVPGSFPGFQTASGARVSVSTQSQGEDEICAADSCLNNVPLLVPVPGSFPGFQTASGALSESESCAADSCLNNVPLPVPVPRSFPGFQTASGVHVSVSSRALDSARSVFGTQDTLDVGAEGAKTSKSLEPEMEHTVPIFSGFQTASSGKVDVSKLSLRHAKRVLLDEQSENTTKPESESAGFSNSGFQTAVGGKVTVSKGSRLGQAKKGLGDRYEDQSCSLDLEIATPSGSDTTGFSKCGYQAASGRTEETAVGVNEKTPTVVTGPGGFQTARGAEVNVSQKALQHAQTLWSCEEERVKLKENRTKPASGTVGFQTAGGAKVSVSQKALQHAQTLWSCEEERVDLKESRTKLASGTVGFQTAGGAKVSVSQKALQHAQTLWSCEEERVKLKESRTKLASGTVGFQTAGGAKVSVSQKALQHAQTQWSCEEEKLKECPTKPAAGPVGFQTAGGAKVGISQKALQHAHRMWSSEESSEMQEAMESEQTSCQSRNAIIQENGIKPAVTGGTGFQTAGGAKVSISQKALQHAHRMWSSEESSETQKEPESEKLCDQRKKLGAARTCGFQTAGGSDVCVSAKALQHTHRMWSSEESSETQKEPESEKLCDQRKKLGAARTGGFQTAGGSDVCVSQEALQHVQSVWSSEESSETQKEPESEKLCDQRKKLGAARTCGFQTAGGSNVYVSEKALQHAHGIWSSEESSESLKGMEPGEGTKTVFREGQTKKTVAGTAGFQTAGGAKVSVSQKALQHAERMRSCEESSDTRGELASKKTCDLRKKTMPGFQTAGGANVSVSHKALQHAETMWNCEESSETQKDVESRKPCDQSEKKRPKGTGGFQTAGGATVSVSQKALQHAETMWNSGESSEKQKDVESRKPCDQREQIRPRGTGGFQTAGGAKVSVSQKALQHAETMWNSGESSEKQKDVESRKPCDQREQIRPRGTGGFQTAGGAKVSVSQKALQHAETMWNCEDSSEKQKDVESRKTGDQLGSAGIGGFQTAGGATVSVSHQALQHAETMWSSEDPSSSEARQNAQLSSSTSAVKDASAGAFRGVDPGTCQRPMEVQERRGKDSFQPIVSDDTGVMSVEGGASTEERPMEVQERRGKDSFQPIVSDDTGVMSVEGGASAEEWPMEGQERRGKDSFQPIVSDDTGVMSVEGGGASTEEAVHQRRVTVKRAALFADTEAILHDRASKRVKLHPATAVDHNDMKSTPLPPQTTHPRFTSKVSAHKKNTPAGNIAPSFQPPYKKAKMTPVAHTGPGTVHGASSDPHTQRPGFRPPPSAVSAGGTTQSHGGMMQRNAGVPPTSVGVSKSPAVTTSSAGVTSSSSSSAGVTSSAVAKTSSVVTSAAMTSSAVATSSTVAAPSSLSSSSSSSSSSVLTPSPAVMQSPKQGERRSNEAQECSLAKHVPSSTKQSKPSEGNSNDGEENRKATAASSFTAAAPNHPSAVSSVHLPPNPGCESHLSFSERPSGDRTLNVGQSSGDSTPGVVVQNKMGHPSAVSSHPSTCIESESHLSLNEKRPSGDRTLNVRQSSGDSTPGVVVPKKTGHPSAVSPHPSTCMENKSDLSLSEKRRSGDITLNVRQSSGDSTPGVVVQKKTSNPNAVSPHPSTCMENKSDLSLSEKRQPGDRTLANVRQSVSEEEGGFCLQEARMRQEKLIRVKKRRKVGQVAGRWLTQKMTQRQLTFDDLLPPSSTRGSSRRELLQLGVSRAVCAVSSVSAEDFRLHLPSFYPGCGGSVLAGDGALLLADAKGYVGKEEFHLGLMTVEGVDPGLVSESWVHNHYRWIVWKLAAYEVTMPSHFAARALTPDVVMYQLKYRYDREVDRCQRSALKRIVERDDTACKRLVLCVSDIKRVGEQTMLEVTDGWYCLPCKPDSALLDLIDRRRLGVGQKIVVSGAELAGSQESCSPLELSAGLHLKVSGNSTRPAPSQAKLGYQRNPSALCVPLSSLSPLGGLVSCLDVVLVRKYPTMYMEKPLSGGCVFRSAGVEERARHKHEEKRQSLVEKLCSQIQAQMEREEEGAKKQRGERRRYRRQEMESLSSGAEISEALDLSAHPEELQSQLSGSQMRRLYDHRQLQQEERQQRLNERVQQALQQSSQEERTVVPLQKLRIVGCSKQDVDSKTSVMLTVWRPGQDWDSVQEGKRYRIFSLTAAQPRSRSMAGQVELTAGRQTKLQEVGIEDNLLDLVFEKREVYQVRDLQYKTPPYGEFDFVGMVVGVRTAVRGSDAVHAVDSKGDMLLLWFWGGLQAFSLQETLREGAVFAASSLRLKPGGGRRQTLECSAALELSAFSATGKTPAQRHRLTPFSDKHWRAELLEEGRRSLERLTTSAKPLCAPAVEQFEDLPASFLENLMTPLTQDPPPSTVTTTNININDINDLNNTSAKTRSTPDNTSSGAFNTSCSAAIGSNAGSSHLRGLNTTSNASVLNTSGSSNPPGLNTSHALLNTSCSGTVGSNTRGNSNRHGSNTNVTPSNATSDASGLNTSRSSNNVRGSNSGAATVNTRGNSNRHGANTSVTPSNTTSDASGSNISRSSNARGSNSGAATVNARGKNNSNLLGLKLNTSLTPLNSSFSSSGEGSNPSEQQPLSPGSLETKRKRAAQKEKLGRLQSYGRAPCLSPLPSASALSPAVGKAFKPPTPHRK